jgi:Beta-galactosidase/beta-glucuronidase
MESSAAETKSRKSQPVNDTFAHIAQRIGAAVGGLKENPPEPIPDVELPAGPFQSAHDFEPLPRPSTPEDLKAGVAALREQMAPFLRNLVPPLPATRRRFPIKEARWRMGDGGDRALTPDRIAESGEWQTVSLPHYGGPIGPATAYYQFEIVLPAIKAQERIFLRFLGADYRAQVYLNGVFLTLHEGFFDPFEIDVTAVCRPGEANRVLVRLDNDFIANGNDSWGKPGNGSKIYAATGLGWDEPGLGWHHCPPGMGLHDQVYFEVRPEIFVKDLWVRPNLNDGTATLHVGVENAGPVTVEAAFQAAVCGRNFEAAGPSVSDRWTKIEPGFNTFRIPLEVAGFRTWSPEEPWLYEARVTLTPDGGPQDTVATTFGMRSFEISEAGEEKGRIFLNGEEIRLRGANTMGHEQQCVFHGDLDRLRDDILIAKYAGLNFLRITQRPVQQEVYEACDQLGMMVQTDLPLFGKVPRHLFAEVTRQAGAMERLIRGHASCVLVSFINEPFPLAWGDTTHRHMTRAELEHLLRACSEAVRHENPDRQIKPVDGDYDPPSDGLPDNHCYCGWYVGHAIDMGLLHRGHWVPTKPGWRYACGEFGAEGLESADLMRRRYPADWLPANAAEEATWTPSRIARCQTGPMHGLWMDAGRSMEDWVRISQEHQAWATRVMTRAFRRDRRMNSFAVHLLIDAFPAGWMKTLVDCERTPKPAFFTYREALQPLLADIRSDRWAWWGGEVFNAEVWICHDRVQVPSEARLRYVFEVDGRPVASGSTPAAIPKCSSLCQGTLRIPLPTVSARTKARLRVALVDAEGRVLTDSSEDFWIFQRPSAASRSVVLLDADDAVAAKFAEGLGWPVRVDSHPGPGDLIVCSRGEAYARAGLAVENGATLLLLELPPGTYDIGGQEVTVETAGFGPRQFVSRNTGHPAVAGFLPNDFRFWHDPSQDSVTALLDTVLFADQWSPVLGTVQAGWKIREPMDALACAERGFGKGRVVVCQVKLAGRTATNPPAELFVRNLLGGA